MTEIYVHLHKIYNAADFLKWIPKKEIFIL